jgi:hypothetical protein
MQATFEQQMSPYCNQINVENSICFHRRSPMGYLKEESVFDYTSCAMGNICDCDCVEWIGLALKKALRKYFVVFNTVNYDDATFFLELFTFNRCHIYDIYIQCKSSV